MMKKFLKTLAFMAITVISAFPIEKSYALKSVFPPLYAGVDKRIDYSLDQIKEIFETGKLEIPSSQGDNTVAYLNCDFLSFKTAIVTAYNRQKNSQSYGEKYVDLTVEDFDLLIPYLRLRQAPEWMYLLGVKSDGTFGLVTQDGKTGRASENGEYIVYVDPNDIDGDLEKDFPEIDLCSARCLNPVYVEAGKASQDNENSGTTFKSKDSEYSKSSTENGDASTTDEVTVIVETADDQNQSAGTTINNYYGSGGQSYGSPSCGYPTPVSYCAPSYGTSFGFGISASIGWSSGYSGYGNYGNYGGYGGGCYPTTACGSGYYGGGYGGGNGYPRGYSQSSSNVYNDYSDHSVNYYDYSDNSYNDYSYNDNSNHNWQLWHMQDDHSIVDDHSIHGNSTHGNPNPHPHPHPNPNPHPTIGWEPNPTIGWQPNPTPNPDPHPVGWDPNVNPSPNPNPNPNPYPNPNPDPFPVGWDPNPTNGGGKVRNPNTNQPTTTTASILRRASSGDSPNDQTIFQERKNQTPNGNRNSTFKNVPFENRDNIQKSNERNAIGQMNNVRQMDNVVPQANRSLMKKNDRIERRAPDYSQNGVRNQNQNQDRNQVRDRYQNRDVRSNEREMVNRDVRSDKREMANNYQPNQNTNVSNQNRKSNFEKPRKEVVKDYQQPTRRVAPNNFHPASNNGRNNVTEKQQNRASVRSMPKQQYRAPAQFKSAGNRLAINNGRRHK
ncbi:MAG: hypothetical protein RL641_935 [Candidatus Parcubacteria bacterium]|jgi:hypothetical protein